MNNTGHGINGDCAFAGLIALSFSGVAIIISNPPTKSPFPSNNIPNIGTKRPPINKPIPFTVSENAASFIPPRTVYIAPTTPSKNPVNATAWNVLIPNKSDIPKI